MKVKIDFPEGGVLRIFLTEVINVWKLGKSSSTFFSLLLRLLVSFMPTLLLSILTSIFLPSHSISLSYFIHAVPMCECLRKYSCMSSTFPLAILNCTCFFLTVEIHSHKENLVLDGNTVLSTCNTVWTKPNSSTALQCCNTGQ